MKTNLKIALLLMLSLSLMSSTCSSNDDDDGFNPNNANQQQVINTAQSGNWIVTNYFDTDSEETNHFTGYTFTFGNNGTLIASNGSNTITGTWSVTDDDSNDDSPDDDDLDFNIFFASPNNFNDLSDDWDIISASSTKIELIDVSGGNGGTDYLTFEKQ